jgi:tRNA-dihydrouridine synthase A
MIYRIAMTDDLNTDDLNIGAHRLNIGAHRLAVAPMMDWTDRHCRFFHRLLAPSSMLYSEMVTADAIIHGDCSQLLAGHHVEIGDKVALHPSDKVALQPDDKVALQLGGSDPTKLAAAVVQAKPYHYAEYNLNVGCPSDRVQSGCFGAVLMAEPERVGDCAAAMIDAAGQTPVTIKCRIGIDDMDSEEGLDRFVATVAERGVKRFIIHARKAWLSGLSPKENRTIPPLDYDRVYRLKAKFADLKISINGGITTAADAAELTADFDGVMVGRGAYQTPYVLAEMSARIFGHRAADRMMAAYRMADYADEHCANGTRLIAITRHMLGLMSGLPGARGWRRALSEDARKDDASPDIIRMATDQLQDIISATRQNAA